MNISFILRKDKVNKNGLMPVRMLISVDGERIRKNVKNVKTTLKHWKNQRIKANLKSESYNYHLEYNKQLDELENKVKLIYRYLLLNNITINRDNVLEKLESNNFGINNISPKLFFSFQEYIDTNKTTKSPATIKKYKAVKKFIEDFQVFTNFNVSFDNITIDFYEKLRDYSYNEKKTLNNYFGKIVGIFKSFMSWAHERGYHNNLEFKKFKVVKNSIEVIYLKMDELMTLYNYKFESKRLEHVRDFYCFGCFTGLRFSDIKQLRASNVFDEYIIVNIQKTKTIDHKIPLNNYAKAILDKYKGTLYEPLPSISGQKFNKYIKECCQIVGIDTPTNITRYMGQKRIDKVLPKYELITSHTARKTFVTNSLVLGMKEMVVRNITGHKDEASFKRYVEIADDFKKQEMNNTWDKI